MKHKDELVRTIKFTLFSISAGVIEIVLFEILNHFTNWDYWGTYLPALIASVIWNFTLNREYTFKSANNIPIAMVKVAIFYAIFTENYILIIIAITFRQRFFHIFKCTYCYISGILVKWSVIRKIDDPYITYH